MPHRALTVERVLAWADAHRLRTGRWPHTRSGRVRGVTGQSWQALNLALVRGCRGLPGGSSLARLLEERRGRRNQARAPRLTIRQVLAWADAYRARSGRWPTPRCGSVHGAPGETWLAISSALWAGNRGLRGGETLAQLLRRHGRDVPPRGRPPRSARRKSGLPA
jgi:hypothetical protein